MTNIVGAKTLGSIWERLALHRGQHTFLTFLGCDDVEQSFTYAQFNDRINQTANVFLEYGVKKGEGIGIQLYDSPEVIAVLFALAKIGAVGIVLDVQYTPTECEELIERCNITKIVTEFDLQDYYKVSDCADELEHVFLCHVERTAQICKGFIDLDSLVYNESPILREQRKIDPFDTFEVLFTSGTSRAPKGVELTHANFIYAGYYTNWQHAMTENDRFLTTMPSCHSNMQLAALAPVLTTGSTLILLSKYHATRFWHQVQHYQATVCQAVSMMVRTMLFQPVEKGEQDHFLRAVQYYLPLTQDERDEFEERFNVRLQNCYGLTESVCWVLTDLPTVEGIWPSVGRPGLGYEVAVFNDSNEIAMPDEIGSLRIKGVPGLSLMKGYYRDEEATKNAFTDDGWLLTGDLGYTDASGRFYFTDRDKNIIKRAGENVSAAEVEFVLESWSKVAEAAVVSIPDKVRDEGVKAYVVPVQGENLTFEEVVAYCSQRLANYKVPTVVEIVADLPRTNVGKIARSCL